MRSSHTLLDTIESTNVSQYQYYATRYAHPFAGYTLHTAHVHVRECVLPGEEKTNERTLDSDLPESVRTTLDAHLCKRTDAYRTIYEATRCETQTSLSQRWETWFAETHARTTNSSSSSSCAFVPTSLLYFCTPEFLLHYSRVGQSSVPTTAQWYLTRSTKTPAWDIGFGQVDGAVEYTIHLSKTRSVPFIDVPGYGVVSHDSSYVTFYHFLVDVMSRESFCLEDFVGFVDSIPLS